MYSTTFLKILLALTIININCIHCKIWNVINEGIIPSLSDISICNNNTKIINNLLNKLQCNDTLLFPYNFSFWFNGGINGNNLKDIVIQIDGTINFQNDRKYWPTETNSDDVLEAMYFEACNNITFTSSNNNKGLIDGHGNAWYGAINYCIYKENRPRLLHIYNSKNILIEYLYFKDSAYWNVYLNDVKNVHVHNTNISAKRDNIDHHDLYDITAFNTDGFDINGENIYIHDCEIWNDDDCIAVKPQNGVTSKQSKCSKNMLFERINASGLGLTIGSVSPSIFHSCVDNITFRDSFMYKTWKGIYMKSAPGDLSQKQKTGQITNILYQNITMIEPSQYSIWLGPQQAIYHHQCSLLWPYHGQCPITSDIQWENITLKNIFIQNPKKSPGVIIGNNTNPMKNIYFDNVIVNNPGKRPWGNQYYKCYGVTNFVVNNTNPIPECPSELHQLTAPDLTEFPSLTEISGYSKVKQLMQCLNHEIDTSTEIETNTHNNKDNKEYYILWIFSLCVAFGIAVLLCYWNKYNGKNRNEVSNNYHQVIA